MTSIKKISVESACGGPVYQQVSNYISYWLLDEITYPFPNWTDK